MKNLIIYYSRGGHTEAAVKRIGETVKADTIKVISKEGFTEGDNALNPQDYDNIIIACPTHWWQLAVEMKRYLEKNKFEGKKLYLVLVCGGATLGSKHNIIHRTKGNEIVSYIKLRTLLTKQAKRDAKLDKWIAETNLAD
ncbi:MAG: hypothetical protein LUD22_04330 [Coprobacillus sp.]|nr:hypothetical protein [Coprobacillus sp.]